ncbi:MAG: hypothetical protein NTW74_20425, partial [Acidobacteria bacterium]|nr:hypothetical protein [Acidobacteriota bacterium]
MQPVVPAFRIGPKKQPGQNMTGNLVRRNTSQPRCYVLPNLNPSPRNFLNQLCTPIHQRHNIIQILAHRRVR